MRRTKGHPHKLAGPDPIGRSAGGFFLQEQEDIRPADPLPLLLPT